MADDRARRSRRLRRDGILFALGIAGLVAEFVAAIGFGIGPHWALLVVSLVLCGVFVPALRHGDRALDAIRFLSELDDPHGDDRKTEGRAKR